MTITRVLPASTTFATACEMSSGARNWPFLMLTTRPGRGRGDQQVGLAAQERGNLQDVGDVRGGRRLGRLVDVGQDRHRRARLDRRQNAQPLGQTGAAERAARRPVRLVVGRLENERHLQPRGDRRDLDREIGRVALAFDDTRTADEHERVPATDGDVAYRERGIRDVMSGRRQQGSGWSPIMPRGATVLCTTRCAHGAATG